MFRKLIIIHVIIFAERPMEEKLYPEGEDSENQELQCMCNVV